MMFIDFVDIAKANWILIGPLWSGFLESKAKTLGLLGSKRSTRFRKFGRIR